MSESMCEGCVYLVKKGADGTKYDKKYWYCSKLWNRSQDIFDARYICNKRFKKLQNGSGNEQQD